MKRRAVVEPVIGHLKAEHRVGRDGDRTNAVLAAAGHNFALLLRWLRLLCILILALFPPPICFRDLQNCRSIVLHGRLSMVQFYY